MTEFRVENLIIPSVDFNGVSTLPSISEDLRLTFMQDEFELDEEDGLYVNYGMVDYAFPYKVQDNYDRELKNKAQVTVVLENEYLKATFLPQFGGKLRSLFDKVEQKELLFVNSVIRPGHLGIRNVYMSGGVEWNCGYVGHNPFTCDWLHTARTHQDDGTPVLRFYQYERIRGVVYQMDFFLPEKSHFLYARTKIINPQFKVVPMYWWSNISMTDVPGKRVIVPADNTFTARDQKKDTADERVTNGRRQHPVKVALPVYNGIDVTYPLNNIISIDYFWNIPQEERKFICQIDETGYGLVHTSTKRLKGRKLFVWGDTEGGERWKNFLTADDETGSFNEIQAGIAQTQYECIPMPPKTVWEWAEAYGAIHTDPAKTHGDWKDAREEVSTCLTDMLKEEALEELLRSTKAMSKRPADEVLFHADGWGALEEERRRISREDAMCAYLDFGPLAGEQQPWLSLLQNGTTGEHDPVQPPISYMCQEEWTALLKESVKGKDKDNWFTWLQLGLNIFIAKDYERAEKALEKSLELARSPWALYALAILNRDNGNHEQEVSYMLEAWKLLPEDVSLAKAVLCCLYENNCFAELKDVYESMNGFLQAIPRCRSYYAFALTYAGDIAGAEEILYENGGLLVPDIRECETITLDLWYLIEESKAKAADKPFDRKTAKPPRFVDFRMFANSEWLNGGEIL